jgi:hypothetical protein
MPLNSLHKEFLVEHYRLLKFALPVKPDEVPVALLQYGIEAWPVLG